MICQPTSKRSRTFAPQAEEATKDDATKVTTEEKVEGQAKTATTASDSAVGFLEIDRLEDCGINVADIEKLKAAGYNTILSVVQSTRKELSQLKGFGEGKVEKVIESAQKLCTGDGLTKAGSGVSGGGFMSGCALLERRRSGVLRMTTGSLVLDKLLQGGIESTALTELFGENRSGKTQLCHTMCVTAQLPLEQSGGNGKVCYIDTEGTFRPEKIISIAERFGLVPEEVLENILYARAHTHEHLGQLVCMLSARMVQETFSLVIIDSLMAPFRVDFSGRGDLAERQQVLGKTLNRLQKLADQFNVAVMYTNHVMADPSGAMTMVANPSKPIGGFVLAHASTHRLQLRIGRGEQRICKINDSPSLPAADAVFQLSDQGIIDAAD